MRFYYVYRTSDGVRHEESMYADSRESVFAALRAKGIRAIKVVAADGTKANGEVHGVSKRVVVGLIGASVLLAVATTVWYFKVFSVASALPLFQTSQTRRQVIGDSAIVEKGIRTGWEFVFEHVGERFLASFAIPGVKAGQRNTSVEEISEALRRKIKVNSDDGLEARQIKAMVEGMKVEAREYVAAGGNVIEYGRRLTERQDLEIAIFERAKADIEAAKIHLNDRELEDFLERKNAELRNLGIRPVVTDD